MTAMNNDRNEQEFVNTDKYQRVLDRKGSDDAEGAVQKKKQTNKTNLHA